MLGKKTLSLNHNSHTENVLMHIELIIHTNLGKLTIPVKPQAM